MTSRRRDDQPSRLMRAASFSSEVHLRHMMVRPALAKLDTYLNDACLAGLDRVKVIHGKGGGAMKGAVADYLSRHPLVTRHYAASPSEGNGGVTIAELG